MQKQLTGALCGGLLLVTELRLVSKFSVILLLSGWASGATASLIGDSIYGCGYAISTSCLSGDPTALNWFTFDSFGSVSGDTAVVTDEPTDEFFYIDDSGLFSFSVNFSSDTFTLEYEVEPGLRGQPQEFLFTGLEWIRSDGFITGLTEADGGALPISSTSFTDHSLLVSVGHISASEERVRSTTFNILTSHPESIPEPATLLLMGMGLAGVGFTRRRKLNA